MPAEDNARRTIFVSAIGDVHAGPTDDDRLRELFDARDPRTDLILLAGDLTQLGEVEEARSLGRAVQQLDVPVVAVLGNHDWHSDRADEISQSLTQSGVVVL